jgi:DnaJ-class molecular chaperone
MRDPYAVLGVARDASEDDIKKAYRRLAKKHHPDLNPGRRANDQQFREITAAYDLLSDQAKRARFDRGEIDANGAERFAGFGGGGFPGGGFGGGGQQSRAYRRATEQSFSFDEIIAELLGRGGKRGAGTAAPEEHQGDTRQTVKLGFVEAALGGKRRVTLGDGRTIAITVPAGIESGQTLRLKGQGKVGARGVEPGDAYLDIEVEPHPLFQRKERNIHLELPVTLTEAVLGATVTAPTIHGSVSLKVPRGSNSGATLRLKGKGIAGADGKQGDQLVKLRVVLPEPPDAELTAFLERWGVKHAYDVRGKLGSS